MIITGLVLLFSNLWALAFQVFPSGTLPSGVTSALSTTISWIWVANIAIDVNTLLMLVGLFFTIELLIQAIELFFWVYSKIPVLGKK